ncbi:MAG: glycosyltransferase family 2 protein, partial [Gemmataceae bacterium]
CSVGVIAADRGGLTKALQRARYYRDKCSKVAVLLASGRTAQAIEGIPVHCLEKLPIPAEFREVHVHGDGPCEISDRVRLALEKIQWDIVEFPSRGGLGYRAIQAKRMGTGFPNTKFQILVDGISELDRVLKPRWIRNLEEMEECYAEKYAVENACCCIADALELVEFARNRGWRMPGITSPPNFHPGKGNELPKSDPLVTICVPHYNHADYLPAALESLKKQDYPNLEVLVIDDGSNDAKALDVFSEMRDKYPEFRFLSQENAGIGATRNRALQEGRGEYYLPMDADNVAKENMVSRFVSALSARPDLAGISCYFLAFDTEDNLRKRRFLHAYRPTGGPDILGCLRNVYGDATALYRRDAFLAVGGYETDRGSSFEDWEAFVKLRRNGYGLDVLPEHLFYYRLQPTGFSRTTSPMANHLRVLRQFHRHGAWTENEREELWNLLASTHFQMQEMQSRQRAWRYRMVDFLHNWIATVPGCRKTLEWVRSKARMK